MLWRQEAVYETGIDEQSAVSFISDTAGLLVFSDDSKNAWQVRIVEAGSSHDVEVFELRPKGDKLKEIEGAVYDPESKCVLALSEKTRRITRLPVSEDGQGRLVVGHAKTQDTKLARVQRDKRKGYEGLAYLPSRVSPDGQSWLVAVNEAKPRALCFYDPTTLAAGPCLRLPDEAEDALDDLSGVCASPDGALFVLSDESNAFAELRLQIHHNGSPSTSRASDKQFSLSCHDITMIDSDGLPWHGRPRRRDGKLPERLQPEGITFDANGRLWIVAEAASLLIRFGRSSERSNV